MIIGTAQLCGVVKREMNASESPGIAQTHKNRRRNRKRKRKRKRKKKRRMRK